MLDDPQVEVKCGVTQTVVEPLGGPQTHGHPARMPGQEDRVLPLGVIRELGEKRYITVSTRDLVAEGDGDRVPGDSPGEIDFLEHATAPYPDTPSPKAPPDARPGY